jgi:hypothetical protein
MLGLKKLLLGDPTLCGGKRSPKWGPVRIQHLLNHHRCEVCGCTTDLEVHHIQAFHKFPELELDPNNLLTLGERCPTGNHHLLFGHLGNWSCINPDVVADAGYWLKKIQGRR